MGVKYDEIMFNYIDSAFDFFQRAGMRQSHIPYVSVVNITCEVSIMIDTSKRYLHFTFGKKWNVRLVRYVKTKNGFYIKPLKPIK